MNFLGDINKSSRLLLNHLSVFRQVKIKMAEPEQTVEVEEETAEVGGEEVHIEEANPEEEVTAADTVEGDQPEVPEAVEGDKTEEGVNEDTAKPDDEVIPNVEARSVTPAISNVNPPCTALVIKLRYL